MSPLYAAFCDLAHAYKDTPMGKRDQAREDLVAYGKAMVSGNTDAAIRIEKRWDLFGYPQEIVSIGLHAAADGKDHMQAVDEYMEEDDG